MLRFASHLPLAFIFRAFGAVPCTGDRALLACQNTVWANGYLLSGFTTRGRTAGEGCWVNCSVRCPVTVFCVAALNAVIFTPMSVPSAAAFFPGFRSVKREVAVSDNPQTSPATSLRDKSRAAGRDKSRSRYSQPGYCSKLLVHRSEGTCGYSPQHRTTFELLRKP